MKLDMVIAGTGDVMYMISIADNNKSPASNYLFFATFGRPSKTLAACGERATAHFRHWNCHDMF